MRLERDFQIEITRTTVAGRTESLAGQTYLLASPDALRYADVQLPVDRRDMALGIQFRDTQGKGTRGPLQRGIQIDKHSRVMVRWRGVAVAARAATPALSKKR